jgi:hypothetical protein
VAAEQPETAGSGDRFLWEVGDVVGAGEHALLVEAVEELLQFALDEAKKVEVGAFDAELFQELCQVVLDPVAPLGVVGQGTLPGQGIGDVDEDGGDLGPAQVLGGSQAHVAGKHGAVPGGQDGAQPVEIADGRCSQPGHMVAMPDVGALQCCTVAAGESELSFSIFLGQSDGCSDSTSSRIPESTGSVHAAEPSSRAVMCAQLCPPSSPATLQHCNGSPSRAGAVRQLPVIGSTHLNSVSRCRASRSGVGSRSRLSTSYFPMRSLADLPFVASRLSTAPTSMAGRSQREMQCFSRRVSATRSE